MKNIYLVALIAVFGWTDMNSQEVVLTEREAVIARQKATCGTTEEGKTRFGMWEGRAYSRVPGEKDKHLFNLVGVNTRHCKVVEDPVRGRGFRSVSREIMMYLDPETNEIMDTWTNPWTEEEVEVLHVANDPVNMRGFRYEKNEDGSYPYPYKVRKYGEVTYTSDEIPLFYDNPLGSDFQVYVGGAYHAMEIFNTSYMTDEILDANVKSLSQSNIAWTRVAQWLPWMQMGSKSGIMIFNATGYSTFDRSEIWPRLQKIMNERYALYNTPPPLDDDRVNETSWTVFKKSMEGKEPLKVRGRH